MTDSFVAIDPATKTGSLLDSATLKSDLVLTKTDVGLGNCDNTSDAGKPVSTAQQTALDLKCTKSANLSDVTVATARTNLGLGTLATQSGTFSGTSSGTNTGDQTSFVGTAIGYATGAGGTVTQSTSKSTGVTLSKLCGTITMNAAALAAATIVTFTVTDTLMTATDVVACQHDSGGTIGAYTITPNTSAAGSFKISVRNNTASSLSEALVIRFAVIRAVTA